MNKEAKYLLVWIIVTFVSLNSGCATTEYASSEAQSAHPGIIIEKKKIVDPNRKQALRRVDTAADMVVPATVIAGSVVGSIFILQSEMKPKGDPYEYVIDSLDGRKIVLIHSHSGFDIGDCVNVLVGKETGSVKMAYGSGCF